MEITVHTVQHLRTNEMWARYQIRGRDVILWSVEKNEDAPPGAFRRFLPLFARHLCLPSALVGQFDRIAIEDVMHTGIEAMLRRDNWVRGGLVPRNAIGQSLLARGAWQDPSFQMEWDDFLTRYCNVGVEKI